MCVCVCVCGGEYENGTNMYVHAGQTATPITWCSLPEGMESFLPVDLHRTVPDVLVHCLTFAGLYLQEERISANSDLPGAGGREDR